MSHGDHACSGVCLSMDAPLLPLLPSCNPSPPRHVNHSPVYSPWLLWLRSGPLLTMYGMPFWILMHTWKGAMSEQWRRVAL